MSNRGNQALVRRKDGSRKSTRRPI